MESQGKRKTEIKKIKKGVLIMTRTKVENGYKVTMEATVDLLKDWGGNFDILELMAILANGDGFDEVNAYCYYDNITYKFYLNEKGREITEKFGTETNTDYSWVTEGWQEVVDDDSESVRNSYEIWGIDVEDEWGGSKK